jgi:hypothetical protein
LLNSISGTITPWILGILFLLVFLATAVVVKSWREMKSSPYYFMRRQAEKRLQTYSVFSLVLLVITAVFMASTVQAPQSDIQLTAVLTNAKPADEDLQELVKQSAPPAIELLVQTDVTANLTSTAFDPYGAGASDLISAVLELPEEFDRFEPTAELNKTTDLGEISFSTDITDNYEAIDPTRLFSVGSYTIYATFSYDGMEDGMEWAWVWRRDGEVLEGGNELWKYGSDGPGYIYFNPEEGFQAGEYSLEVWVNGELMTRAVLTMTGTALSAGN